MFIKELYLKVEPYIGRVTLPTGETGTWFYNPETTMTARFATKVVFNSTEQNRAYTFILLLTESFIDNESMNKVWSIAEDLSSSENSKYTPHFSDEIYHIKDCLIER